MKLWSWFGSHFALGGAVALSPFSEKLSLSVKGRRGITQRVAHFRNTLTEAPLWAHVASSGEFEQVLPILERIRERSQIPIFLSYFSPSGARAVALETKRREARGIKPPWDYADYSPWDLKRYVDKFLEALKPSVYLVIHRELWPHTLQACQKKKIPRLLFALYLSETLSERRLNLYESSLRRLDYIGTTADSSTVRLKQMLGDSVPIENLGDPRIERVLARKQLAKPQEWVSLLEDRKNLIFASVWPEDFEVIEEALTVDKSDSFRYVFVPHEPSFAFLTKMQRRLAKKGIAVSFSSRWSKAGTAPGHLIIDEIGYLAELYRIAYAAFVGGSFQKRVHNVLEPAAYSVPVFTGPYIQNSAEATELAETGEGLRIVRGVEEMSHYLKTLAQDENFRELQSQKITAYLERRQGAAQRCADVVLAVLRA